MYVHLVFCVFLVKSMFSAQSFSGSGSGPPFINYPSFSRDSCTNGTLICMGSVSGADGYLSLTPEPGAGNPSINQVGRVLYNQPVVIWPAVLTITFTVRISPVPGSTDHGDGMTFIIAQDDNPSPPGSFGSFLGVMDTTTQGGLVRQVAVELDTFANPFDPDGNHIGIDTTSMINRVAAKSLNDTGIDLASGKEIRIQIEYNSWTMDLEISVGYSGSPLVSFLNQSIDLSAAVPSSVYVGFTAATGSHSESHQLLDWFFQATPLPTLSSNNLVSANNAKLILSIIIPFTGLLIIGFVSIALIRRLRKKNRRKMKRRHDLESQSRSAAHMPIVFTYKELADATSNFSKENLLGTGGFGSVYKAVISSEKPAVTMAVKKISATSKQGEKEYLAEIGTIGRLKHKNIVQLHGWCHEDDHLLLVYEYMANGSLDRYIGKTSLEWKIRYNILTGLASALLYLHEECGSPVVHRDVKPNNVMLDSEFLAHLGDFGLARLLKNNSIATTRLAGTPAYLSPEVGYTGKATPESDVYSFGMVIIEVVTGRRATGIFEENSLVDYIWGLHEENKLLEGVDELLEGKFDEEEVKRALIAGLACLHPCSTLRPKIRKVEQVFLNTREPLMELPKTRPRATYIMVSTSSTSTTATTTTTEFGSGNGLLHSQTSSSLTQEKIDKPN